MWLAFKVSLVGFQSTSKGQRNSSDISQAPAALGWGCALWHDPVTTFAFLVSPETPRGFPKPM